MATTPQIRLYGETLLGNSLPEHTNLWCWHCCHTFTGVPRVCPTNYDHDTDTYTVIGNFCSFACTKAWQNENKLFNLPVQRLWLLAMANEKYGYEGDTIEAAPPRIELDVFGGPCTIDEFRAKNRDLPCTVLLNGRLPGGMQRKDYAVCYGAVNNAAASLLQSRNDSTEEHVKAREGFYNQFLAENQPTVPDENAVATTVAMPAVAAEKKEAASSPQTQSLSFMVRKKRRKTNTNKKNSK